MSKKTTYNFNTDEKGAESLAETFVSKLGQISLSKTEAQEMRERLISYSNMHAVPAEAQPIPSPYFSYFTAYSRVLVSSALIILILVSGTGISYAAEGTLPGQALYGVKVAVVEPIQGAFITSTTGKANWQNTLTERRLTEASTLAAENNLSSATQAQLAQAVSTHVALAQQEANQLSDSGNATAALSVRSNLDASLSAHVQVLAAAAPNLQANGDATTSSAVVAFLDSIEAQRTQVDLSRQATEIALGAPISVSTILTATTSIQTPAQKKAIAYVNAENSARVSEESSIIRRSAALFRLLPKTSTSTSTASTTISATSTKSTDSTTGTSPTSLPFYKAHIVHILQP